MKAYIYPTLTCPKCGLAMMYNPHPEEAGKPGTLKCYNLQCELNEILFKAPSIELERVDNFFTVLTLYGAETNLKIKQEPKSKYWIVQEEPPGRVIWDSRRN